MKGSGREPRRWVRVARGARVPPTPTAPPAHAHLALHPSAARRPSGRGPMDPRFPEPSGHLSRAPVVSVRPLVCEEGPTPLGPERPGRGPGRPAARMGTARGGQGRARPAPPGPPPRLPAPVVGDSVRTRSSARWLGPETLKVSERWGKVSDSTVVSVFGSPQRVWGKRIPGTWGAGGGGVLGFRPSLGPLGGTTLLTPRTGSLFTYPTSCPFLFFCC